MIIYLIENLINHKVYIGQTIVSIKQRMQGHRRDFNRFIKGDLPCSSRLYAAIKKYGWGNFSENIIQTEINTQKELDDAEIYWIDKYKATDSNYGYNIERGGKAKGKVSDETKIKISIAHIGKHHTEETRRKISKRLLKRRHIF